MKARELIKFKGYLLCELRILIIIEPSARAQPIIVIISKAPALSISILGRIAIRAIRLKINGIKAAIESRFRDWLRLKSNLGGIEWKIKTIKKEPWRRATQIIQMMRYFLLKTGVDMIEI